MRNLQVAFLLGVAGIVVLAATAANRTRPIESFQDLSARIGEDVPVKGHVLDARVGRTGHTIVVLTDGEGREVRLSFPGIVPVIAGDEIEARGRVASGLDGIVLFASTESLRTLESRPTLTVAEVNSMASRLVGREISVIGQLVVGGDGPKLEDLEGGHSICVDNARDPGPRERESHDGVIKYDVRRAAYCLRLKATEGEYTGAGTRTEDLHTSPDDPADG